MGKTIYRICLAIILVLAAAGGVYYYRTFFKENRTIDEGTFVNEMDYEEDELWAA